MSETMKGSNAGGPLISGKPITDDEVDHYSHLIDEIKDQDAREDAYAALRVRKRGKVERILNWSIQRNPPPKMWRREDEPKAFLAACRTEGPGGTLTY